MRLQLIKRCFVVSFSGECTWYLGLKEGALHKPFLSKQINIYGPYEQADVYVSVYNKSSVQNHIFANWTDIVKCSIIENMS